jgi:multicomponent Na+:H+ antiporter subunit D
MLKHLGGEPKVSVDTDWIYRKAGPRMLHDVTHWVRSLWRGFIASMLAALRCLWESLRRNHSAKGVMGRTWGIGNTSVWVIALLTLYGLVYLLI